MTHAKAAAYAEGVITLAIDTSSEFVSAAVLRDNVELCSVGVLADRGQGESLAPLIERALGGAGVQSAEQLVVGVGPGPFTGLRVGLVTAQVLAHVWQAHIVGVCSLDAVAYQARRERPGTELIVATDAKRSEVYWARYDNTGQRVAGPSVDRPDVVGLGSAGLWVVGAGAHDRLELFESAGAEVGGPRHGQASDLVRVLVDRPDSALPAQPLYLRKPDAAEPGPRKRVNR